MTHMTLYNLCEHNHYIFNCRICNLVAALIQSCSHLQVFGEVDNELYEGDLLYTPVVKKWYYEVVITDIAVGGESLALDCKKVMFSNRVFFDTFL